MEIPAEQDSGVDGDESSGDREAGRADCSTRWRPAHPTDVALTLARLRHGAGDPTLRLAPDGAVWRTTLTGTGPATLRFTQASVFELRCQAWGDGAREAVEGAAGMVGGGDDPGGFEARHPLLVDAHRRMPGLRIPRTGRVLESLIPAILEQRVIGQQATASFRALLRAHGAVAPGPAPAGMLTPPSARAWQLIPSWEWHRAGVDPQRSRTVMACLAVARQLEAACALPAAEASARLRAVPGVGAWTAAEVAQRAFGDADALSVGDYHLATMIGHTLFGAAPGDGFDDAQMVAALAPWRPHRYRVVRLLEASGALRGPPRRGPRMPFVDHRSH